MTRGLRALIRTPGYFALSVAALALGAGSATVMFSVTESVLWRPLPFPEAERLVLIASRNRKSVSEGEPVSRADFLDWRSRARSFSSLAATTYGKARNIAAAGFGERIQSASVTANFFAILGATPALGRGFAPEDERTGAKIAVLTNAYWRSRFDASPEAIGMALKLDGESYLIAGVLPADFHLQFVPDPDLYLPLAAVSPAPARHELGVIGRLSSGVSPAAALAEMQGIARQSAAANPRSDGDWTVNVENLRTAFTRFQRGPLLLFFGFAGLTLLVACANVAALQMARYAGRRHESALRLALGATRRNLLREALTESAWIAVPGAAAGVLLALWGLEALRKFMPPDEFVRGEQIRMDPWTLVFVLAICGATMLLFALAPVFSAGRFDLNTALQDSSKGATMGAAALLRIESLIAGEVALSFLLLFAAGLFVRSHASLLQVPLGFNPSHVAALRLDPGGSQRLSPAESLAYYRRILDAASAFPGIRQSAIAGGLPLMFDSAVTFRALNRPAAESSLARIVSPGYFTLMAIPLLAGRGFTEGDSETGARVAIVNQRLAARIFGAENPVGKTITLQDGGSPSIAAGEVRIVAVAANTKELDLSEIEFNDIYLPFAQNPPRTMYLAAKTQGDADAAIPGLRSELRALDPEISISGAAALEDRLHAGLRGNRFRVFLVSAFAALAALLAAVGIYGAIAFAVARRAREFGLRMALGAAPGSILRLAMWRIAAIAGAGGAVGLGAALALGAALRETLYLVPGKHSGILHGVGVHDPASLAAAAFAILGLAFLAALLPAMRAARIDPAITLRQD
jgi:putative ABC transport system permease protein